MFDWLGYFCGRQRYHIYRYIYVTRVIILTSNVATNFKQNLNMKLCMNCVRTCQIQLIYKAHLKFYLFYLRTFLKHFPYGNTIYR